MNRRENLKEMIQEKPLLSLGGALAAGFAVGSGLALPLMAGAGLNRAGLGRLVKAWLAQELQQGLRQWIQPSGREQAELPGPGQTRLARQVSDELSGYAGTHQ